VRGEERLRERERGRVYIIEDKKQEAAKKDFMLFVFFIESCVFSSSSIYVI